ncbi:MAG: response regulator [Chloroflexi bacterium]|nr:response regulator [Chloroflexota bacterium]
MDDNAPIKVVYIEDDAEMLDLIMLILNRPGMSVRGASDAMRGLDLILQDRPDLILLDLMMPDQDGWDLYQRIRANEATRSIPVIIITAKAQPIDINLGLHVAKADDYICKPFHMQELWDSISKVMNSKFPPALPE